MRTLFLLTLLAACGFSSLLHAQIPGIEARFWYFGTGTDGLEFNGVPISSTNIPAKLTDKINGAGYEGMIVVNDPTTGALRFYSDGNSVIQSNHTVMNNGGGLMGHFSGAQTVHCVPDPANGGRFFLITKTSHDFNPGNLYSTLVDFTNASFPLGTLPAATKNVLIDNTGFSQGSIVASKPGTQDYWWVGHVFNTATYHVRPITAAGFGAATVYTFPSMPSGEIYAMAFSGTANKVAAGGAPGLILMDFDPMTGVLSNATLASSTASSLGNFSPNGSKLYCGQLATGAYRLHQYDLGTGVMTNMNTCCYAHDTKVAPNGKMYHIHTYNSNDPIAVIDFPDLSAVGNLCGYNSNAGIVGAFNGESRRFPEFVTLPFVPLDASAFTYLHARQAGGRVRLEWGLDGCENHCRFRVERSEGEDFHPLADIVLSSKGGFSLDDHSPRSGRGSYRIIWTDGDGKGHTSSVVTVASSGGLQPHFSIGPNPCTDRLGLQWEGEGLAVVEITDLLGRTRYKDLEGFPGMSLDVRDLASGTYLVRVTVSGWSSTRRFERMAE